MTSVKLGHLSVPQLPHLHNRSDMKTFTRTLTFPEVLVTTEGITARELLRMAHGTRGGRSGQYHRPSKLLG